jgi:hypothetical protein
LFAGRAAYVLLRAAATSASITSILRIQLVSASLIVAIAVIHGTNELGSTESATSAILSSTTAGTAAGTSRTTHSLLAATWLVMLPFAATMAAPSPVAGVLRLVRSFIHRRPVVFCAAWYPCGGIACVADSCRSGIH